MADEAGVWEDGDLRDLLAEYPLAWVIAPGTAPPVASLPPLIGEHDAAGRLTGLIGHLARGNPLFPALTARPRALVLVSGPQGYVSPGEARQEGWGPTWNYAQFTIAADLTFDGNATEASLDTLIGPLERDRPAPWRKEAMGPRYHDMLRAIIGFRTTVISVSGRLKLGQDERPETLRAILANHPDPALVRWMRRMNAARL